MECDTPAARGRILWQIADALEANIEELAELVTLDYAAKVADYIADGKLAGASILCRGETAGDNASFVTPTVITGITPDMRIAREEVFGPVLTAMPFVDADDVISAADDSDHSLAGSIWTEGLSSAVRMSVRLQAGTVCINAHAMYDASLHIIGIKQSGWLGTR